MPIITTNTGRKLLRKASSLVMIPYVYNDTVHNYVLGQNAFDISAIIADSIALEQQDGEAQTKVSEYSAEPIIKNVTTGEWRFSAQCLDLQNDVLRALFGAYYNREIGISAIRKDYETLYALIRIRFADENIPDVYLPKVSLNSKLMLQQMKSRGSQGNIGGTAMSVICAVGDGRGNLYEMIDPVNGGIIYYAATPVLFVPPTKRPMILHHYDDGSYVFDEILMNFGNGDCCAHNRVVNVGDKSHYETE